MAREAHAGHAHERQHEHQEDGQPGRAHDDHSHDHLRSASRRALIIALVLLVTNMVLETVGGVLTGSLGLLAHAAHMVTDTLAIFLALLAMWIAERPATITRTFGFQRVEVIAVLFNAVALWILASWIGYGAYQRVTEHFAEHGHAHEVEGALLLTIACIGLAINCVAAVILYRSSRHHINVEGAFWHIVADLTGSAALVLSAVLILVFDWEWVDLVLTMFIAALIMFSSIRLALRVFRVLLEFVPRDVDMYQLCSALEEEPGVTVIHDIHAWTITPGYEAFTAHVLIDPEYTKEEIDRLTRRLREIIRDDFGVRHITLQVEQSVAGCEEENHHAGHLAARSQAEFLRWQRTRTTA